MIAHAVRRFLSLTVLMVQGPWAAAALGQEVVKVPAGPPPRLLTVAGFDDALGLLELVEMRTLHKFVHEVEKGEVKTRKLVVLAMEGSKVQVDGADFFEAAGRRLGTGELDMPPTRMENETPLVKTVSEELRKSLLPILTQPQHQRLRQIELQQLWLDGFFEADVQAALRLTNQQQDAIKAIGRKARGDVTFGDIPPRSDPFLGAMLHKALDEAAALLSAEQRKEWEALTGPFFVLR